MRRDKFLIHDLENEVALLRARLRDTPPAPLAPEPTAAPVQVATAESGEPGLENHSDSIYGDVEIVYEGEAARPTRARPKIELYETASEGLIPDETELAAAPPPPPAPSTEIPLAVSDLESHRLPVMKGKIPTVQEQLRRATPAPIAATPIAARPVVSRPVAGPPISAKPVVAQPTVELPADKATEERARVIVRAEEIRSEGLSTRPAEDDVEIPEVVDFDFDTDTDADEEAEAEAAAPAETEPPRGNPLAEYKRHIAALKRGKHKVAVAGMRSFLERYPRHYLSDNVQFYVGQSFYARKKHAEALREYKKVVQRYWRGNKLPDAMLKVGLCQLALGHPQAGRASLRRLVTRFPATKPAQQAKARLEELDKQ